MKYLSIFLLLVAVGCNNQKGSGTDEAVAQEVTGSNYGEEVNTSERIELSQMLEKLETEDSLFVTVKGEITSTCKMKGCWMKVALPDGEEMRVTFKDYGFFVPKEGVEGKTAIFEGWVTSSVVDEETRKHYAKDAGKSEEEIGQITGDEEQLAFVAEGVFIEK